MKSGSTPGHNEILMTNALHYFITGASNGLNPAGVEKLQELLDLFSVWGFSGEDTPLPAAPPHQPAADRQLRSQTIRKFLTFPGPALAVDPTGGDLSNTLLPLVFPPDGFPRIPEPFKKAYWSMSDNSTILNALLDRGLCRSFHGHGLTLVGKDAGLQRERFLRLLPLLENGEPVPPDLIPAVHPLGTDFPDGSLVGGNLRAFCKLLGTPFLPRTQGKILLVESLGLEEPEVISLLAQLDQTGILSSLAGVLIGRFTAIEKRGGRERLLSILSHHLPPGLLLASCPVLGHGSDGWTVPLGEPIKWNFN